VYSAIFEMVGCVCILYFGTYQSQLILFYRTCVQVVDDNDDTAAYVLALMKLCLMVVVAVE
jgi:hypothetical protein